MLTRGVRRTEVRVLGEVEVWTDGDRVPLPRRQLGVVMGVLALHANNVVPVDRLMRALWPDRPPKSSRAVLQTRVSELRALLTAWHFDGRLVTHSDGYGLRISPDAVDAIRFSRCVIEARDMASPQEAYGMLRSALGLWRGPVLSGSPADGVHEALVQRLESIRLTAVEEVLALEAVTDCPDSAVDDYVDLAVAHPERERLTGQVMLALQRAGRTAEAVRAYERTRRWLADELGVDPGAELQRLYLALLRSTAGPAPDPPSPRPEEQPRPGAAAAVSTSRVPRTLPPDLIDFTGRVVEAGYLADLVGEHRRDGVLVAAVCGPAGVGKTALAVHVAHQLEDMFPDGQLYADLHRSTATPTSAHEVLARFLRALGVVGLPAALDERIDLYRHLLADRRLLIVLDDAASDEQVLPLIPGGSQCVVIVTGRSRLGISLGARTMRLDVLNPADATRLLSRIAGSERVKRAPEASADLTRACGYLPLAIRAAGAKLQAKPHWSIRSFTSRLQDERYRLDHLVYGTLDVRQSLAGSIASLAPDARRLLHRLAELDASEITAEVAATLLDICPGQVRDLIEDLYDAHLVDLVVLEPTDDPVYRIPDLVRLRAKESIPDEGSTPR
jgi:DNA-binding SARP family transcriptional activator